MTAVRVKVPASTANLGSGFDALGMALTLHDTVFVEVGSGPASSTRVAVEGEGAGRVPVDERHLVVRMIQKALRSLGADVPELRVRCQNRIPHSRGLGSSAAAIVAGIAAGYELAGASLHSDQARALDLAASVEGHADNVAASLLGGLVIAWQDNDRFRAVRRETHPDLRPVALIPGTESATRTTRGLLPEAVPHADAAFAAGRAALAVHALSSDPSLLLAATDDRLHQDYREPAWPGTVRLIRSLRELGIPAAVSGAGPTVLAFPPSGLLPSDVVPADFRALRLSVETAGVSVQRGPAEDA